MFEIDILDYVSKAQSIKKVLTNWTSLKLKTCSVKYIINRIRQATDWKKVFLKDIFDKILLVKVYEKRKPLETQ